MFMQAQSENFLLALLYVDWFNASTSTSFLACIMDTNQPVGRAKGGLARREKLSPERRSEIARNAALAKHDQHRVLEAIRKGNFLADVGFDAECYVLNDSKKTAVMSQRGMAGALGLSSSSGTALRSLVHSKAIASTSVGFEIAEKLDNPLIFKDSTVGGKLAQPRPVHGHDVTLLIDICNAIIQAKALGTLATSQARLADQASILLSASAKSGIQNLVYRLTGYDATKEEVISAFKAFVQAEAKKYESEFPVELYLEWARLYGHRPQRSWKDMHLTINHVYYPLAKSDGKLLSLLRDAKTSSGSRNAKLFQFLTIVGARALRFQLGRIYDIAQDASTSEIYEQGVAKRFGGQQLLNFSNE
jgi:P63C domain